MSDPGQNKQSERKQSLLNKCLNERRRRDQENHYIEELAEIISASIADMSNSFSVKPEKCAILQETVKQIKQIKQGGSGGDSAVQQSHVSSSKPAILADDVLGPLLLEALDGFLFVVNCQGKVEFVSNNVTQYLKYNQDDLVGKSVYNIIHVGDHAQFSNNLLPMSVSSGLNWPADNFNFGKGRTFNCRLLIKSPCEDNDDVEIKQTYISQYENMQISSILQPYPSENINESAEKKDSQSCLVCIARRLPLAEKTNTMLGVEQFTTRQDLNGKIIECDNSGISHGHFKCPDFVGKNIQDFCHVNDSQQLSKHLQEAISTGHNTSAVYRFRLQENKFVFIQTKSHLFHNPVSHKPEFIISTHSIIRECETENELKGSASGSLLKSIIGPSVTHSKLNSSQNTGGLSGSGTSSMAVVGNPTPPMITSMSPGNLFGLNDDIGDDFLNSMGNWDTPSSDTNLSGGLGNNNVNYSLSGGSSATSVSQSWNSGVTQIKISQHMQQQIHRSMSTGGQGQVTSMASKRPLTLQNINQRSASLDMGQKSPGYSQGSATRNQGFQLPGQRGPLGYGGSQRSPAASPSPHNQGRFNIPFPPRTPSPMPSPSSGMSGSNWGHHQPSGLHSLQSYDSQVSITQDRLLQQLNGGLDSMGSDNKLKKAGKLCQLLTQNSPPPNSGRLSESGTNKKSRSRHNSRHAMEMSPADSMHQSPQPGPGQSPPEKPQSTSNDDGDHGDTEKKEGSHDNVLLKSLLSQDDDMEDNVPVSKKKRNNSSASQGPEAMALETNEPLSIEMDKNEAEAKKPNNILLKQLLSTEDDGSGGFDTPKRKLSETNESLINRLLEDEQKQRECTSAPAESTSQDSDLLARRRHQSGPQEPQSTTTHSIPMPSLSSPLPSPLTTSFSQSQSTVDTTLLKGLFQNSGSNANSSITSSSVNNTFSNAGSNVMASSSVSSMLDNQGQKDNVQSTNNKKFDQLLHLLWDNNENSTDNDRELKVCIRNLKRKQSESMLDLGGSSVPSSTSGAIGGPTASKLSKDNALLTQLLSKRATDDIVVNTQLTLQPSSVPQAKFSAANLAEKLLKVKPGNFRPVPGTTASSENRATVSRQLEAALMSSKGNPSSSHSLESMLGFSQNSNSSLGLGDSASTVSTTQFKEQYEELQQLLSQTSNSERTIAATEVDMSENTDPLLAQILQQAQDLQQDLTASSANINQVGAGSNSIGTVAGGSGVLNQDQTQLSASQNNNSQSMDIFSQLEQVLGENVFTLTDSLLNSSQEPLDMNEQLAIDAIQQQLMNEFTMTSSAPPVSAVQPSPVQAGLSQQRLGQNLQQVSPSASSSLIGSQQDQLLRSQFQRSQVQQQQQALHHGYNQTPTNQSFPSPQGPRLPQGSLPSALHSNQSQQRPMFSNVSRPTTVSLQVRQSLLQQQQIKQLREQRQQEQHQRLLMQQRQQRTFSGQRFTPDGMPLGNGVVPPPPFPENLAELMNSPKAPNVTLQRNHIPAPMSPRYGQGIHQPQQQQPSPSMGQMIGTNNPQLSPSYPQQQQQQSQGQWNMRQQQSMQSPGAMGMQPQGTSQYNRHRSLSGGTLQGGNQPGNPRFPFSDSQFGGNQGAQMTGMFGQQQQQMFPQNRGIQRQMNVPGRGSPRTSQSPFGTSPQQDSLLLSPPEVSPNSSLRGGQGQQVSPNYGGSISSSYSQSVPMSLSPQQSQTMTSPQYSQPTMNAQGIDMNNMNLFSSTKKPFDVPLSVSTPNPSQYIKQELRNICNARLEKPTFQPQLAPSQLMQQLQQQQQQESELDTVSELPPDILDQINEMTRDHGFVGMEDIKEEKVVEQKREEAKKRMESFRNITTSEDPDKKATRLFRSQLLTQNSGSGGKAGGSGGGYQEDHRVNIVQKEPRTPVEDIKPANHKDSLLQQLLSD